MLITIPTVVFPDAAVDLVVFRAPAVVVPVVFRAPAAVLLVLEAVPRAAAVDGEVLGESMVLMVCRSFHTMGIFGISPNQRVND